VSDAVRKVFLLVYYHLFLTDPYPLALGQLNPNLYLYVMATKKVPQRRNSNAGKSTGKSKSAKYFAANPEAREKKNAYNTAYHSSEERKKYRAELNSANKKSPNGDKDKSHTKSGKLVNEKRSSNRARNGKKGSSKK